MIFSKFTNAHVSERVTVGERLAYGCGDFSSNIMYSAMAAFLMFYYTDYVGVSAAVVGTIMLVSRLLMVSVIWLWELLLTGPDLHLERQEYGFYDWLFHMLLGQYCCLQFQTDGVKRQSIFIYSLVTILHLQYCLQESIFHMRH